MQRLGNFDQARSILENALREQSTSREAAECLIGVELEQGRMDQAVSLFESLKNRGIPTASIALRIAKAFEKQNRDSAA